MTFIKHLLTTFLLLTLPFVAAAQATDSVDVSDYDISLDMSGGLPYHCHTVVTLNLLRPCTSIGLELIGTVDSLFVDGQQVNNSLTAIPTAGIAVGETVEVEVYYRLSGYVEDAGIGGLHVESNMTYNIGVSFSEDPHFFGRALFPCRDNLTDKATYTLRIIAKEGWSAECSGVVQSRTTDDQSREHSVWRINQPVCTYLVGISQAPYSRYETTAGGYPVTIGYTSSQDLTTVQQVFALLDTVVPMYERCFGPYRWHRIGYIPTSRGSMEHVNNVALAYQVMSGMSELGQNNIAHELAHAWFGNLVTCANSGDMWINEGGATFSSEVAREATHGRASATAMYQSDLEKVVRTAHYTDGGYRPLHDMPHGHTYGSTTYDKGGLVWHSLRGLMGDELFYATMHTLFDRCAFGTLDAYSLRDSLEAYSGMDLTDFFRQHVFSPGFVDYNVEMVRSDDPLRVMVRLRQQGVGTDSLPQTARVPLSFISHSRQQHDILLDAVFTDNVAEHWIDLPFAPYCCVLDPGCLLSDAATVEHIDLPSGARVTSDVTHSYVRSTSGAQDYNLYMEHHYGHPHDIDTIAGVVRTTDRYWVVNADTWKLEGVNAFFRFQRMGYNSSDYPHLDPTLYQRTATYDSLELMWRPNAQEPWRAMSHIKSGDRNEGYLKMEGVMPGEYTIAIVDRSILGVAEVKTPDVKMILFPNPVPQGASISLEVPSDQPFAVVIYDTAGREVWHAKDCRSGQTINPNLTAGTYLVRIENNFISLQSNLIQL